MQTTTSTLPTLEESLAQNKVLHEEIAELKRAFKNLVADLEHFKKLAYAQARRASQIGRNQDTAGQQYLFGEEPATNPTEELNAVDEKRTKKKPSKRNGRLPIPNNIPRVVETIPPNPEFEFCDCCDPPQKRVIMSHEVTEVLEYVPAKFFVNQTRRPNQVCPSGKGSVMTDPLPPRIIDKGRPGVSLLVAILVSKYVDHLPLHRQVQIYKRAGVRIPESTLCDWVAAAADALAPIVYALKRWLLKHKYLQADETPAKARYPNKQGNGKGQNKQIYFFAYGLPWKEVVFDYQHDRKGIHAKEFLDGFSDGVLQVDEFSGYNDLFRSNEGLARMGCWAHAFRKFKEALEKGDRPTESKHVMSIVAFLTHIETSMRERNYSDADRLRIRTRIHTGQLAKVKEQIEKDVNNPRIESDHKYGTAIRYVWNNWDHLIVFLEHGDVEMDNNGMESAIRDLAIGRKNWMHVGHVDAGERAANVYTVTVSCKRLGIDPALYLQDVLERLPTHPLDRIDELLPRFWQPLKKKEITVEAVEASKPE